MSMIHYISLHVESARAALKELLPMSLLFLWLMHHKVAVRDGLIRRRDSAQSHLIPSISFGQLCLSLTARPSFVDSGCQSANRKRQDSLESR